MRHPKRRLIPAAFFSGFMFFAMTGAVLIQTVALPSVAMAQSDSAEAPTRNLLGWAYEALGLGYSLIFLMISFTLVALIVMNVLTAVSYTHLTLPTKA